MNASSCCFLEREREMLNSNLFIASQNEIIVAIAWMSSLWFNLLIWIWNPQRRDSLLIDLPNTAEQEILITLGTREWRSDNYSEKHFFKNIIVNTPQYCVSDDWLPNRIFNFINIHWNWISETFTLNLWQCLDFIKHKILKTFVNGMTNRKINLKKFFSMFLSTKKSATQKCRVGPHDIMALLKRKL